MNQPLIQADGLSLRYGKKAALEQVSFSIPKGRVVGLLGHNGAGKTTLMKALVGLARPDGQPLPVGEVGEVLIQGDSVMAGYWRNPEATAAAVRGSVKAAA